MSISNELLCQQKREKLGQILTGRKFNLEMSRDECPVVVIIAIYVNRNNHGISFAKGRSLRNGLLKSIFVRTRRHIMTLALAKSTPLVWISYRSALGRHKRRVEVVHGGNW